MEMQSNNKDVCWGCRSVGHYLWDCPMKRRCPICGKGLVKLMKVVHVKKNLGKLFYSCTAEGCTYFDWLKPKETDRLPAPPTKDKHIGQSSKKVMKEDATSCETEEFTHFFNTATRIVEEKDVEVAFNITFRKDKGKKTE